MHKETAPMTRLLMRPAALCALALILAPGALAASDTVNATATLEQQEPPLEVEAKTALSFGAINIPNGREAGHACRYSFSIFGPDGNATLSELDENGVVIDAAAPTASACDWGADGTPATDYGVFAITCNPATTVSYTASFASAGVAGVVFAEPVTGSKIAARSTDGANTLQSSLTTSLDHACPVGGFVDIAVGASITLADTAEPAAGPVTVGTITLDASY